MQPLTDAGDAALAVAHALSPLNRLLLDCHHGSGASPADYIAEAKAADAHLDRTEPWWDAFGKDSCDRLVNLTGINDASASHLIGAALIALIASGSDLSTENVVRLAERAALWWDGRCYALTTITH